MEQTNIDALFAIPDQRMDNIRKWLRYLLIVHIAMLSVSVLRNVISFGKLYNWINATLDVAAIFCLLQLRRENRLYKLAVGLMAVGLLIDLYELLNIRNIIYRIFYDITIGDCLFVQPSTVLVYCAYYIQLLAGLGAVVTEYLAHRALIKPFDAKIAKWWLWMLAAYLAVSALSSGASALIRDMIESGTLSIATYQTYIFPLLRLPGIAVSLLYMVCLYQTERKLAKI